MDMKNLSEKNFQEVVDTVRHPLIILDENLVVQFVNRTFYTVFQVSQGETVGKKIYDLGNGQWNIPQLRKLLDEVIPRDQVIENYEVGHDFDSIGHRIMILNARILDLKGKRSHLILLSIEDRTEAIQRERELSAAKEFNDKIIETIREPLVILTSDYRIRRASSRFYNEFQTSEEEIVDKSFFEVDQGQWNIPELRELLENVLPDDNVFDNFSVNMECQRIGYRSFLFNGRRLDHLPLILLAIEDVTEKLQKEMITRENQIQLERLVKERTAQVRMLSNEISLAEQKERQRISEILHDELQQLLVANKMHQNRFIRLYESNKLKEGDLETHLQQTITLIDKAITQIRSLSHQMNPMMIHQGEFIDTVQWLCNYFEQLYNLKIDITHDRVDQNIEEGIRFFLYHSFRELLLNVVKHADVDRVHINVHQDPDQNICLSVHDEGKGCDVEKVLESTKVSGMGLKTIKYRAELLGGGLKIDNSQGKGFHVEIRCPARIHYE
jgi:signal transduction histidine kinase